MIYYLFCPLYCFYQLITYLFQGIDIFDLFQEKGPSNFAFSIAFAYFQLIELRLRSCDSKISYQN